MAGIVFLLSVISAFVTAKLFASKIFAEDLVLVFAPSALIITLCALDEWLFHDVSGRSALDVSGPLRGAAFGAAGWIATMFFATMFTEVGDKFIFVLVVPIPFAIGYGAFSGGLLRYVGRRWRHVGNGAAGKVAQPSRLHR